jgi:alpha-galactosidase
VPTYDRNPGRTTYPLELTRARSYTNSDDCWSSPAGRNPVTGELVADPAKFPLGLNATVAVINSYGLDAGIYTARASHTCAGRAGSCGHEAQDAAFFASVGMKYIKDDDCGPCTEYLTDYTNMQEGIWATGQAIYLSVEGDPPTDVISATCISQQKRVGHDISSSWQSMVSLVDIGSGLWPYAHGASDAPCGNRSTTTVFVNDLDMLEVGAWLSLSPG